MKFTKKFVSVILVILMLVASCPIGDITGTDIGEMLSFKSSAASYNVSAAVEYARRYAKNYNPAYPSYSGKDCANFVSQCLCYGGLEQDGTWYTGSFAWINCDGLLSWLTGKGGQKIYPSSAYDIDVGDVIFTNGGGHVVLCTGRSGGTIYFCGHTNDRLDSTISVGSITYAVKMNGIYSPTPTQDWDFSRPATYPSYSSYLKAGSRDDGSRRISFLQTSLNWLGYYCGNVDGVFGSSTEAQVRNFQADHGLSVDGVVGPDTWNKLIWRVGVSDIGNDFWAYIVLKQGWRHIENCEDGNIRLNSGGNDNNNPRQIWHFERTSEGNYKITNAFDDRGMDLLAADPKDGMNVYMYEPHDGANQRWIISYNPNGSSSIRTACGLSVLDSDGSSDPGSNIKVWTRCNTFAQEFEIYKCDYSRPAPPDPTKLSVSVSNKVKFNWTSVPLKSDRFDTRNYRLRIWKGTSIGELGTEIIKQDTTGLNLELKLEEGTYTANITTINSKYLYSSSRSNPVTFTVKKHTHTWQLSGETPATCTKEGVKTYKCTSCTETKTESLPKTSHTESTWIIDTNPTCLVNGARHTECTVCHKYIKQETIRATGHTDKNNDGKCDVCKANLSTSPTEPKPTEPEPTEPAVKCSCNCHKSGFMGLIWNIINFFNKLFRSNQYCDCGVKHW